MGAEYPLPIGRRSIPSSAAVAPAPTFPAVARRR